jgi:DNA-binding FadR family transcriptional regulator
MNGSVILVANPLQSHKLGDRVVRVIAARIINGEIGDDRPPPTEQDICEEFGISKTTAREVISSLVAKGLVDVRHGRRMRVRTPGDWNHLDPLLLELRDDPASVTRYMADLHDVRMLLEPEMAARAAMLATPAQLARMRDAVELLPTLESDPDAYLEVDIAFHTDLAEASGNIVLAYILESVRELLRASRRRSNLLGELPAATQYHRPIFDAILAGAPETARQAMRSHLLSATRAWVVDLDGPAEGGAR